MKLLKNIIFIGASTAIGTVAGMIANPKNPTKSSLLGALIGLTAGTAVSVFLDMGEDASINYYGKSSGLYEGYDDAGII